MSDTDEKKVLLSDILEKCLDFRDGPSDDKYKEVGDIIASLDVRERLTLAEKGLVVLSVLNQIQDNQNALECAFDLTAGFFFKGTLSYVANLSVDIPASLMNIETYDLLVTLGMEDRILEFCEKDHARLRKMLDDAVNFSNVFRLVNSTKLISGENIAELDKLLKGLKETLTVEKIHEFKAILAETDPVWTGLKQTIGEEAAYAATVSDVAKLVPPAEDEKGEAPSEPKQIQEAEKNESAEQNPEPKGE